MIGRIGGRVMIACLALLALTASANAFFGNLEYWHRRDCPRSEYSRLHFWTPEWYKVRACVAPSNLDQYAPGPCLPVAPVFEFFRYRCQTLPPMPPPPYANPQAYYDRP